MARKPHTRPEIALTGHFFPHNRPYWAGNPSSAPTYYHPASGSSFSVFRRVSRCASSLGYSSAPIGTPGHRIRNPMWRSPPPDATSTSPAPRRCRDARNPVSVSVNLSCPHNAHDRELAEAGPHVL